jgi:hypothetical protein
MNNLYTLFQGILLWLLFIAFILICLKTIDWARHRKAGAIAFGLFVQMFLPGPKVQATIEMVEEYKKWLKNNRMETNTLR